MSSTSLATMDIGSSKTAPPETASVNVQIHNLKPQYFTLQS